MNPNELDIYRQCTGRTETPETSPNESILAQNDRNGVQILAAFVTEIGGLRYHLQKQVAPWLSKYASWALHSRRDLLGCYSDDNMTLLELQTLYASLEDIMPADWDQPRQVFEGRIGAMQALLSEVQHFTFQPKFLVSNDATLIGQAISRQGDLKTIHGAVQNALSLVIDRIAPNALAQPKTFR